MTSFRRLLEKCRSFVTMAMIVTSSAGVCPSEAFAVQIEVDQIEISGVSVLSAEEVESALTLTAGDKLNRARVVQSAENLQALYRLRGYNEIEVKSELFRQKVAQGQVNHILRFAVREGRPARIAKIRLRLVGSQNASFQRFWEGIESGLLDDLGMKPGMVFDQEKLARGLRVVKESLASHEFIGAKSEKPLVRSAEEQEEFAELRSSPLYSGKTSRWVSVEIPIDPGEKITFGFRGNTVFTYTELKEFVAKQRSVGLGKDYVKSIQDVIRKAYQKKGYANISIQIFTFEKPNRQERHITFDINEGSRVRIDQIDFDGNVSFKSQELRAQLEELSSDALKRKYYVREDLDRAVEQLIDWIKSKGYLSSKLVTVSPVFSEDRKTVRVVVYLYEGIQTIVQKVNLAGVKLFSEREVKILLGVWEDEPINLFTLGEGLDRLKRAYREKGHLEAKILNEESNNVVVYLQKNRYAEVTIRVDEGHRYRVSRINIEGLEKTDEFIVSRELEMKVGEVLEEPLIAETTNNLRKLGIFSSVTIRTFEDPDKVGHKIVNVVLQESSRIVLAAGLGVRNDLGVRIFTQGSHGNLWRQNHTASATANANRRIEDFRFIEYQLQLGYLWPYFAIDQLNFRPTFTWERRWYAKFNAENLAFDASWDRKIWTNPDITLGFTYSIQRTLEFGNVNGGDQDQTMGSITPKIQFDTRDNPLTPTKGLFAVASFEWASTAFGSQSDPYPIGYTKAQVRTDYYWSPIRDVVWSFSARMGIERSTESFTGDGSSDDPSGSIPQIKQFTLGGVRSLRGFRLQQLNFQDQFVRGTLAFVNYRTQLDLPFAGEMRFGPFLDAGNLLLDRFSFGNLRVGTGFGFHYLTPVGPVNFDFGFNLAPEMGEDPFRFHFSVGLL